MSFRGTLGNSRPLCGGRNVEGRGEVMCAACEGRRGPLENVVLKYEAIQSDKPSGTTKEQEFGCGPSKMPRGEPKASKTRIFKCHNLLRIRHPVNAVSRLALCARSKTTHEAIQGWPSFEGSKAQSKIRFEERIRNLDENKWASRVHRYLYLKSEDTQWWRRMQN